MIVEYLELLLIIIIPTFNIFYSTNQVNAMWYDSSWDSTWDTWWHYKEGVIGGPSYWGQTAFMSINNDVWPSCHQGKMQSPISILSKNLIFDSNLQPLKITNSDKQIDVEIINTGQDLQIKFLNNENVLHLSQGPLAYDYQIFGALIKFGSKSKKGSDHRIDGISFPAELQFYAFNFLLYSNFSIALSKPNGLAAISVFLTLGEQSSADMAALFATAEQVQLKGQHKRLNGLLLDAILPPTTQYMTYYGSLPFPACYETVTWIVLNQAVIITESQLKSLRQLRIAPFRESGSMADNFRTIQKLNNRSIRTNIDFADKKPYCSMQPQKSYFTSLSATLNEL